MHINHEEIILSYKKNSVAFVNFSLLHIVNPCHCFSLTRFTQSAEQEVRSGEDGDDLGVLRVPGLAGADHWLLASHPHATSL